MKGFEFHLFIYLLIFYPGRLNKTCKIKFEDLPRGLVRLPGWRDEYGVLFSTFWSGANQNCQHFVKLLFSEPQFLWSSPGYRRRRHFLRWTKIIVTRWLGVRILLIYDDNHVWLAHLDLTLHTNNQNTVDQENRQICPVKKDWPGRLADLSAGNIILYGTDGHFCSLNLDEKRT